MMAGKPEEGAVAFVGLDHHPVAAAKAGVAAIGVDDAAVDDGGVEARRLQHAGDQAGGGGLAMRAADSDRPLQPHQLRQHLGAAHDGDKPGAGGGNLGVVALDGGGDDDDLRGPPGWRRRGRWRPRCQPAAAAAHWRIPRCRCPARHTQAYAAPRRCPTCRCRRCRRNGSCRWREEAPSCPSFRHKGKLAFFDKIGQTRCRDAAHSGALPRPPAHDPAPPPRPSANDAGSASSSASRSASSAGVSPGCGMTQAPPAACQQRGIGRLVIVNGTRQRHQDRRPPSHRQFRHGGGAGASDHQMRRVQAFAATSGKNAARSAVMPSSA